MSSANRRAIVVRMSLLESMLDQVRRELTCRRKQTQRVMYLRELVDNLETALSNLQREYFDVTLTQREYQRIAQGLLVMEGVISGSLPATVVEELAATILRVNPELKELLR